MVIFDDIFHVYVTSYNHIILFQLKITIIPRYPKSPLELQLESP